MNKMIKVFLLFGLIVCSASVFAQTDTTENIIDVQLKQCLDSSQNYTTSGMIDCMVRARDAWDKELNQYYNLLMQTLSTDEKNKLKVAQRNWLLFRDSENKFSTTLYRNMQGTMWGIAIIQSDLSIIKQRVLELKAYYSDKAPK